MRTKIIALGAIALVALAAGCSSATKIVVVGGPASSSAPPAVSPSPVASWPGPFSVKLDKCGPLSAADQNKYMTNATHGAVVTVTNTAMHQPASPQVTINFMNGSTVDGQNYTTPATAGPWLAIGQSEVLEVDNTFSPQDTCTIASYEVFVSGHMLAVGTYTAP